MQRLNTKASYSWWISLIIVHIDRAGKGPTVVESSLFIGSFLLSLYFILDFPWTVFPDENVIFNTTPIDTTSVHGNNIVQILLPLSLELHPFSSPSPPSSFIWIQILTFIYIVELKEIQYFV